MLMNTTQHNTTHSPKDYSLCYVCTFVVCPHQLVSHWTDFHEN